MDEKYRYAGVDISRKAINRYALEKFGRLPKTMFDRESVMRAKIIDETSKAYWQGWVCKEENKRE